MDSDPEKRKSENGTPVDDARVRELNFDAKMITRIMRSIRPLAPIVASESDVQRQFRSLVDETIAAFSDGVPDDPVDTTSSDDFASTLENSDVDANIFMHACKSGYLSEAQCVVNAESPTKIDVRCSNNYALRKACKNGHAAVAQWLADRFLLTADDARSVDNYSLRRSCANGHLKIAQWLVDRFSLTADDVRACDDYALRMSFKMEHMAVARWLLDRFYIRLT